MFGIDQDSIIEYRDAVFFEIIFLYKQVSTSTSSNTNDMGPSSSYHSEPKGPEDFEPCRNKRHRKESTFGHDFFTYILDNDPSSYHEVMQSPDAAFWREARNSEI